MCEWLTAAWSWAGDHLAWGDLATWVQSGATIGALLYVRRDWEKRRVDERTEQSSKVAHWYDRRKDGHYIHIRNASDLPVYSVQIWIMGRVEDDEDLLVEHRYVATQYVDPVPPHKTITHKFTKLPQVVEEEIGGARYSPFVWWVSWWDANGKSWYRDGRGTLAEGDLNPAPMFPDL